MVWMYTGISIIFLIGVILIVYGFKLTKNQHKKEKYIENSAGYNASIGETVVLLLLSLILKFIPYWVMRLVLILSGLAIIIFAICILLFGT